MLVDNKNPFEKLPFIDAQSAEKLCEFGALLRDVNSRINLISRKDTDDLEYRHIALCAAIGALLKPADGAKIADVGTGGGLPGIAMAILWPQAHITMFDGVGKKIRAVSEMIEKLGLKNAKALNARIESQHDSFDYITGRAVCALPDFFRFTDRKIRSGQNGNLQNGIVYFKGGAPDAELEARGIYPTKTLNLQTYFNDPLFEGKSIVHYDKYSILKLIRR